jgi:hypothetical protein
VSRDPQVRPAAARIGQIVDPLAAAQSLCLAGLEIRQRLLEALDVAPAPLAHCALRQLAEASMTAAEGRELLERLALEWRARQAAACALQALGAAGVAAAALRAVAGADGALLVPLGGAAFLIVFAALLGLRLRRTAGPAELARHLDRVLPQLEAELDPAALGMTAGDELYFHAVARDNREPEPNERRSETCFVRLLRDAEPLRASLEGLAIRTVPEYFRSQRQIIIDTERLLAERDRVSQTELERRSNELGIDQGLLRMRYGGLMGEEVVTQAPAGGTVGGREAEHGEHEHERDEHGAHERDEHEAHERDEHGAHHGHEHEEPGTFPGQPGAAGGHPLEPFSPLHRLLASCGLGLGSAHAARCRSRRSPFACRCSAGYPGRLARSWSGSWRRALQQPDRAAIGRKHRGGPKQEEQRGDQQDTESGCAVCRGCSRA